MASRKILYAMLGGVVVNLPLAVMEIVHRPEMAGWSFPYALFIALWIEVAIFIDFAISLWSDFADASRVTHRKWAPIKIGILLVVGWAWITFVIDQWPCFLGGTGC